MNNTENTHNNVKATGSSVKPKQTTMKPTRKDSNEIALIMQSMEGWVRKEKVKKFKDYGTQKSWKHEFIAL